MKRAWCHVIAWMPWNRDAAWVRKRHPSFSTSFITSRIFMLSPDGFRRQAVELKFDAAS
jgi:hypothetical protein